MRADRAAQSPVAADSLSFEVAERVGSPRELHEARPTPTGRQMVISWATSGAVVLGSTQAASDFDSDRCEAAGLDLVRRRSGGGAVVVQPECQLWVDFYLPVSDPLFSADVSESFVWLGRLWAGALRGAGLVPAQVEVAASAECQPGGWARRLCFCGVIRGEVTLGGKKVVGVCQRRDRSGAWFHSMALTTLDVAFTASLLAGSETDRRAAAAALGASATALSAGSATPAGLVSELLDQLGELGGMAPPAVLARTAQAPKG